MAIELLQHELDRFGVITVMDAMLYSLTGEPLMFLDTLKLSNITSEGQAKEIKGGKYAELLLTYNYGRTATVEFQDALLSYQSMKNLWGASIESTPANIREYVREVLTVNATSKVTLKATPTLTNNAVTKIINVTDATEVDDYTVTGANITFTNASAAENDVVQVYYDAVLTAPNTTDWQPIQALVKSNSFPKTVKFVGKTFIMEQETGKTVEFEIEIPKLKLNSNFTLTMEAEGDASVFDFGGMALASGDHELIKFKALRYLD